MNEGATKKEHSKSTATRVMTSKAELSKMFAVGAYELHQFQQKQPQQDCFNKHNVTLTVGPNVISFSQKGNLWFFAIAYIFAPKRVRIVQHYVDMIVAGELQHYLAVQKDLVCLVAILPLKPVTITVGTVAAFVSAKFVSRSPELLNLIDSLFKTLHHRF